MTIFSSSAQSYWDAGLPAIPLYRKAKNPAITQWDRYSSEMPAPQMQELWKHQYKNGNIGLPLGPQSNMVAIDVDSDDPTLSKILTDLLPETPWVRIGKKGRVMMYRWNNDRNAKIRLDDGSTLVEILGRGNQVVLPPSIHPDTDRPYTSNCNLWDVTDQLVPLPFEFESMLREALIEAGFKLSIRGSARVTDYISVGSRDNQMNSLAGLYSWAVIRGERTLIESLDMMESWCKNFVEHVAGDEIDSEKGRMKICEYVRRDVLEKNMILPKGWDDGLDDEQLKGLGLLFDEEKEAWEPQKILDYLKTEFFKYPGKDNAGRPRVIDYAIQRMVHNESVSELDQDRIFKWISQVCGGLFTIPGMRKRLRQLEQGAINGTDQTELAKAVYEDLSQYGEIRYDQDRFWQWEGSFWKVLETTDILRHIQDRYGACQAARKYNDHKGILSVMASQCTRPLGEVNDRGVNFANGFLDEDLQLRQHDPKYGQTYILPFRYMPGESGKCTRFKDMLFRYWGEDDDYEQKVAALQEAMCATLFGISTDYQRAICLYGAGKCGKSQILEIIQHLLPPGARCNVPPSSWNDRFAPADIANKLLNVCGELSDSKKIQGDRFKEIVAGETIRGEFKNMNGFDFRPRAANWFASNFLPISTDYSDGFNRRWLFLQFQHKIADGERVVRMGELVVMEEREQIVAWAIEALPRLRANGDYTLPKSHHYLVEEMANENNSVRFFLMKSGKVAIGVKSLKDSTKKSSPRISCTDLHNEYYAFCLTAVNARPVALQKFNRVMRELAIELGFQTGIEPGAMGEPTQYCENLTLVTAKRKAS